MGFRGRKVLIQLSKKGLTRRDMEHHFESKTPLRMRLNCPCFHVRIESGLCDKVGVWFAWCYAHVGPMLGPINVQSCRYLWHNSRHGEGYGGLPLPLEMLLSFSFAQCLPNHFVSVCQAQTFHNKTLHNKIQGLLVRPESVYHWTYNYYIASCYFSELIMSDVMSLFRSIMVCERIFRRCNSGRCMIGCLPSAWHHQSFGNEH